MSAPVEVVDTGTEGVRVIRPRAFRDNRGYFSEVYNRRQLAAAGIDLEFVQDNQSVSSARHTVRGLHFQLGPFAQAKLVRVVQGAVLDVAVDIRRGSPSYGRHVAHRLTAANGEQMLVPEGFAHGFVTLEPDTVVIYKVNSFYSAEHDRGIRWDDPALGIDWGVGVAEAVLSDRDMRHPCLAELGDCFHYADLVGEAAPAPLRQPARAAAGELAAVGD